MLSISIFIRFSQYRALFAVLLDRGYINPGAARKCLNVNPGKILDRLERNDIIIPSKLTNDEIFDLEAQNGLKNNSYVIKTMKIFRLSSKAHKYLRRYTKEIFSSVRDRVAQRLKLFREAAARRRRKKQAEDDYRKRLLSLNFTKILKKAGFYGDLGIFGINNAYDFMRFSLRDIARETAILRADLERIERKITAELGDFEIIHKNV